MNVEAELIRDRASKSELGQFMTAPAVAQFMATWLDAAGVQSPHILDAGAGFGGLSHALLQTWKRKKLASISVTAYEVDPMLASLLPASFEDFPNVDVSLFEEDFIEHSVTRTKPTYTHAILNPPYKKISSNSQHRALLRQVGIETGNLYSAFVALALRELKPRGQLVAIVPRSFCNGPYFRPFREFILDNAALTHIHLFGSRTDAFKEDGVLQENIIIKLVKGKKQGKVSVSTSSTSTFTDVETKKCTFNQIVKDGDEDQFIHVPSFADNTSKIEGVDERISLSDLGIQLSTGPVVGFRLREHLRENIDAESVPLIYPTHLRSGRVRWPVDDGKRSNAIAVNDDTRKWLYPNGCYCVVRRFSSKEEHHRVVASVVEQDDFGSAKLLGIDNKLNVFHSQKAGLDKELVYGLAAYLNTDLVDEEFRLFSGHTQVNATDLRKMSYPSKKALETMGSRLIKGETLTKDEIHEHFFLID